MSLDSSAPKNGLSKKIAKHSLLHVFGTVAIGALLVVAPGAETAYSAVKGVGASLASGLAPL